MFETAGNEKRETPTVVEVKRQRFTGPKSPHDLIQEHYSDSPWRVIVCCIFLNCTSRKQLNGIVDEFFRRWPGPYEFLEGTDASTDELVELIAPLGFKNRRAERLRRFSEDFVDWWAGVDLGFAGCKDVRTLHGVGEYAARAYEIFCEGKLGDTAPEDHSLVKYWQWATDNPGEYQKGWKK